MYIQQTHRTADDGKYIEIDHRECLVWVVEVGFGGRLGDREMLCAMYRDASVTWADPRMHVGGQSGASKGCVWYLFGCRW